MQNLMDQTRHRYVGESLFAVSPPVENSAASVRAERFANSQTLEARLRRVRRLSQLMDSALRIPGTKIRFGLDGVLGLVPLLGDAATAGISAWIVREAYRSGVPNRVLAQMVGNIAIDFVGGSVPMAGDLFDVYWKANQRNVALLEAFLRNSPT